MSSDNQGARVNATSALTPVAKRALAKYLQGYFAAGLLAICAGFFLIWLTLEAAVKWQAEAVAQRVAVEVVNAYSVRVRRAEETADRMLAEMGRTREQFEQSKALINRVADISDNVDMIAATLATDSRFDEFRQRLKSDITGPPLGTVVAWLSPDPPSGWAICNGQAIPGDAAALRRIFPKGNLPDLRGHFLCGYDSSTAGLGEQQPPSDGSLRAHGGNFPDNALTGFAALRLGHKLPDNYSYFALPLKPQLYPARVAVQWIIRVR